MRHDDYLWDGSGAPDPEIQRLERLLGRFRGDPQRKRGDWRARRMLLAAAASVAFALIGLWFVQRSGTRGWEVVRLEGAPTVASSRLGNAGMLSVDEWIETDATSRAELKVGAIGQAIIEPNTRVRLVNTELTDHRLALARGTLHVNIWAPPRLFYVDTPSATAIDLGCSYTLSVDQAGASLLHVTTGWVALSFDGRDSFVPAGAVCATRPGIGPGTPCFEDAALALREALDRLDFQQQDVEDRSQALGLVLREARARDAITLWHLLSRLEGAERARIYDRLAQLAPPPAGVLRESVLRGDKKSIERWGAALGLGPAAWWQPWKRNLSSR